MKKEFLDKVARIVKSTTTFKIKLRREFGEYEVEVFENGKKNPKRSYFTDGREDAHETMLAMRVEQLVNDIENYEE